MSNVYDPNDRGTAAINDGEPQAVTLSGREYERYLCGALNDPAPVTQTTVDEELGAMARIVDALGSLDDAARERVMHWANDRFFPVRLR